MSDKNDIKIIAKSVEEFSALSEKLKLLPDQILNQIESAENGLVGFTCRFRNQFKTDSEYFIPNNTKQIKNFSGGAGNSGIGIYADGFYFVIPIEALEYNISYVLLPLKEIVKNVD